jgi:ubiquinol-cytochrome c reductase cytochrome b subunit
MIDWFARAFGRWLDQRLGLAKFVRKAMNHVFPDHWSFMLGEIALYSFVILVITGVYLAMFFHASPTKLIYHGSYRPLDGVTMSSSYASILGISFDVRGGLLVRQMHHWAADIFLAAIVAHLARIFFTAAYRRPREINWMIGLTLLVLAIFNGYFGYSLGGDLLSGAGLRIGYSILISVPVIGVWLAYLLVGGNVPSELTIPHMYAMHIFLIPFLIAGLIALHLGIIWRQFHTNYPGPRRSNYTIVGSRLWPSYTAKTIGLFFMLFAVIAMLGGLTQIDPIWIYGPYTPFAILPGAQPDWYLGWIEGAMRLVPSFNISAGHRLIPNVFFPALLFPVLLFVCAYLYPFVEQWLSFDREDHHVLLRPWEQPINTALGCTVFTFLIVLLFGGSDDVIVVAFHGSLVTARAILRTLALVLPPLVGLVTYAICIRIKRRHASSRLRELAETAGAYLPRAPGVVTEDGLAPGPESSSAD